MRPRWVEIEKENPWLQTTYFDYDKDKEMVKKYTIVSGILPVFIFLNRKGKEILRLSGEIEKKELLNVITNYRNR
jgi:thioredoxin-related protein